MTVAHEIAVERIRQVSMEGWTEAHDDAHSYGQLGLAASCYASPFSSADYFEEYGAVPADWPWEEAEWKPKSYRENLVRAGALIIAEIERLDRV